MTADAAAAGVPVRLRDRLSVAPDVAAAIASGRPVVALESTLISHGLPYPANLEVARAAEAAVRESGAQPATVAIRAGRVLVGLDDAALEALATAAPATARKASRPSLAAALASGGLAATTVSATMIAAEAAGIHVFATGGIGGVHRGAFGGVEAPAGSVLAAGRPPSLDVSSDLEELARTSVAVVCAGPKAILDVPATIEWLETRGVPVVTVGQAEVPGFFARGSGVRSPERVETVDEAAAIVGTHLGLGLGSGILVCVPVPAAEALGEAEVGAAIDRATADAEADGVVGPELTPWLLARVAELTEGRSVRANTALIVNDARVAGALAVRLARAAPA
jgi:pseudouridine-5'-phosphate glycosidase